MLAELVAPWAQAGRIGRSLLVLGLVVSALALVFNFWIGDQADWVNYASAVDRFLHGQSLYSAAQLSGHYNLPSTVRVGYSYPPASILLFVPFAVIPAGVAIYTTLSTAVFLTGLAAIVRREFGHVAAGILGIALIAVVPLPGYFETQRYSNVNLFIAGLFAWLWALPRVEDAAGAGLQRPHAVEAGLKAPRASSRAVRTEAAAHIAVAAGLAASILLKIFPAFFLGWSVRHVGWRHTAWTIAILALLCVVALPLTGPGAWRDYVTALANAEPACSQAPSLTCALQPAVGLTAAKAIALGVAAALALASVATPSRLLGYALLVGAVHAPVLELWGHYELFPFVLGVVVVCQALAPRAQTSLYSPSTASSASAASPSPAPVAPSGDAPSPEAPSRD